jgi:DNA-binding Lrp family transcriptional regulator
MILLDAKGQVIENWQPMDETEWNALEELARAARRRALQIEEKLNSVVEDLQMLLSK